MSLSLMYITNRIEVAQIAQEAGVDRIWIDLEWMGKEERQFGMNTVKSKHCVEDVKKLRPYITKSKLMVRVNPLHRGSREEINQVIENGADFVMLPMYKTVQEVKEFIDIVDGRAKTMLLLETKEAVECLEDTLAISGIDEIHIGLNDLHLSYKMHFMFELLANGTVEKICNRIAKANIGYGFGGIARVGYGDLPAEYIINEHVRLGSKMVILSRSFCNANVIEDVQTVKEDFVIGIQRIRRQEELAATMSAEARKQNTEKVIELVDKIVKKKKADEVHNG